MATPTQKQQAILESIQAYWQEYQVSPSIADLAAMVGVAKATAYEHVLALKKKGFLEAMEKTGRALRPVNMATLAQQLKVPLLGRVAAGSPILAQENIEGWLSVDENHSAAHMFGLWVRGDSMIDAHIQDGDIVIVRKQSVANDGDIVVALVNGEEATVKKLQKRKNHIRLLPMNPRYAPIEIEDERFSILGKVVEVRRRIG